MLNVPVSSPPVPQVSTSPVGRGSSVGKTGAACFRITRANPANSATLTARWFSACSMRTISGVGMRPERSSSMNASASACESARPASALSINVCDALFIQSTRDFSSGLLFPRALISRHHQRLKIILRPDNRVCLRTEWTLHIHFDFMILVYREGGIAQNPELFSTVHASIKFLHLKRPSFRPCHWLLANQPRLRRLARGARVK